MQGPIWFIYGFPVFKALSHICYLLVIHTTPLWSEQYSHCRWGLTLWSNYGDCIMVYVSLCTIIERQLNGSESFKKKIACGGYLIRNRTMMGAKNPYPTATVLSDFSVPPTALLFLKWTPQAILQIPNNVFLALKWKKPILFLEIGSFCLIRNNFLPTMLWTKDSFIYYLSNQRRKEVFITPSLSLSFVFLMALKKTITEHHLEGEEDTFKNASWQTGEETISKAASHSSGSVHYRKIGTAIVLHKQWKSSTVSLLTEPISCAADCTCTYISACLWINLNNRRAMGTSVGTPCNSHVFLSQLKCICHICHTCFAHFHPERQPILFLKSLFFSDTLRWAPYQVITKNTKHSQPNPI